MNSAGKIVKESYSVFSGKALDVEENCVSVYEKISDLSCVAVSLGVYYFESYGSCSVCGLCVKALCGEIILCCVFLIETAEVFLFACEILESLSPAIRVNASPLISFDS